MFNYILFDLDGTLTDPAEGITNSFIHAFKYFGMEIPSYEKLCSFIGPPLPVTIRNEFGFTDEEKIQEGVRKYREYFSTKGLFENKVYPGIPELLQELKEMGKHLVVATSKPEQFAVQIMDHFDLSKYFDFICGSNMDESRSKKEDVIAYALKLCKLTVDDKASILMVGDREHDIIGANINNLKSCGVLFGYGSKEELEAAGATYIISKPEDLIPLI